MCNLSVVVLRPFCQPFAKSRLRPTRLERATYGFEVRCSIQLSYERISYRLLVPEEREGVWWVSNPRQPDPQSGTLPLSYRHHVTDRCYNSKKRSKVSIQEVRKNMFLVRFSVCRCVIDHRALCGLLYMEECGQADSVE